MDPRLRGHWQRRPGFPRTRGDGPNLYGAADPVSLFPPHARGWTLIDGLAKRPLGVSPARAGMDRARRSRCAAPWRFPRTRGDGPDHGGQFAVRPVFPPHARGWTRGGPARLGSRRVSPARAGMDRPWCVAPTPCECFPRTRGDGPALIRVPKLADWFPPHARGWTGDGRRDPPVRAVSPARAGMDRRRWVLLVGPCCFPRTRGDGPSRSSAGAMFLEFPPHARGWTAPAANRRAGGAVSPARAGMDPGSGTDGAGTAGFPRTRGDGPVADWAEEGNNSFPPHARGRTRIGLRWTDGPVGFRNS